MNDDDDRDLRGECRFARAALDERMDRALDPRESSRLDAHLKTCADCRDYADGLVELRRAFGALRTTALPDESLRAVFAVTVDRESWWSRWSGLVPALRPALAGAAAVILAAVTLWLGVADGSRPGPVDPTPRPTTAEVEEAAAEVRYALALVRGAMQRTGRAVVRDVIEDAVVPAFDRVPLRLPGAEPERREGA